MKIVRWFDDNLEIWLVNLLLANIAVWVFVQVVLRYIFSYSLPWSEELVRWCFVWFIWVGVSYAFKTRKHICIDVLVTKLPRQAALAVTLLVDLIVLWCMVKMAWYGYQQIASPIIANQDSIVLFWPGSDNHVSMRWLYASMPCGAFLSAVRLLQTLCVDVRAWRAPEETATS